MNSTNWTCIQYCLLVMHRCKVSEGNRCYNVLENLWLSFKRYTILVFNFQDSMHAIAEQWLSC